MDSDLAREEVFRFHLSSFLRVPSPCLLGSCPDKSHVVCLLAGPLGLKPQGVNRDTLLQPAGPGALPREPQGRGKSFPSRRALQTGSNRSVPRGGRCRSLRVPPSRSRAAGTGWAHLSRARPGIRDPGPAGRPAHRTAPAALPCLCRSRAEPRGAGDSVLPLLPPPPRHPGFCSAPPRPRRAPQPRARPPCTPPGTPRFSHRASPPAPRPPRAPARSPGGSRPAACGAGGRPRSRRRARTLAGPGRTHPHPLPLALGAELKPMCAELGAAGEPGPRVRVCARVWHSDRGRIS